MQKEYPVKELRNTITKDCYKIPAFIDGTHHYREWKEIQFILMQLAKLTHIEFLGNDFIRDVALHINVSMGIIIAKNDTMLNLQVCDYITVKIENYLLMALDLELYEVAENFKKLKTMI